MAEIRMQVGAKPAKSLKLNLGINSDQGKALLRDMLELRASLQENLKEFKKIEAETEDEDLRDTMRVTIHGMRDRLRANSVLCMELLKAGWGYKQDAAARKLIEIKEDREKAYAAAEARQKKAAGRGEL